jgi:hypothetical protein
VRTDWFVPGINLPAEPDNWHQHVDVCKVNGKRVTPLVPDNARESQVFVTLPDAYRAWGLAHGYPNPPTDDCSDVYAGERVAQIQAPAATDHIVVGQTLQVVGSAYIDDFVNYTLDVGSGDNPDTWTPITDQRTQAVDKALLGVWNTTGLQPGRYRLRLRAFDSFGNAQESPPLIVTVSAPATPTPLPTATSTAVPATPSRTPVAPRTTPQPSARPATPQVATPQPATPQVAIPQPATPQATLPSAPRPTPRPVG